MSTMPRRKGLCGPIANLSGLLRKHSRVWEFKGGEAKRAWCQTCAKAKLHEFAERSREPQGAPFYGANVKSQECGSETCGPGVRPLVISTWPWAILQPWTPLPEHGTHVILNFGVLWDQPRCINFLLLLYRLPPTQWRLKQYPFIISHFHSFIVRWISLNKIRCLQGCIPFWRL